MPTPPNPDHPRSAAIEAELAQLEAALTALAHLPAAQAPLRERCVALRAELATLEAGESATPSLNFAGAQTGDVTINDVIAGDQVEQHADQSNQSGGTTGGAFNTYGDHTHVGAKANQHIGSLEAGRDNFAATQQTIHIYYGDQPPVQAATLLSDYLEHVADECNHLRLNRISTKRQTKDGNLATPELRLQTVYTSLTTDGPPVIRRNIRTTAGRTRRFLERLEQVRRSPDAVRPERVITVAFEPYADRGLPGLTGERLTRTVIEHSGLASVADETEMTLALQRPELAIEAIAQQRRLVLLGEPGSGKSTVLRYLGYLLARRAGGASLPLPGWADTDTPVPILIPLAQVAEQLSSTPNPDQALWQTLGTILDGPQGLSTGLRDSLHDALRRGGVILLCDGLDELSAEGGERSPRSQVSLALQRLVARTKARIVVTSRILPYQSAGSWHLPPDEGWQLRTITPLAFGQVRTFVQAWFCALASLDPDLTLAAAEQTAKAMIDELAARPALEPLMRSPLLLTMLALLHDQGRLPEIEVALYEQSVVLLLERWEPVRQWPFKRPGLIERLGSPPGLTLARLRDPLHQLAYEAHRDVRGEEGRGVISDDLLQARLVKFFDRLGLPNPLTAYKTLKRVLAEDAGLLVARDDDAFAFPHLSFQEYLAACFLAGQPNMRDLVATAWQSADRERWRKVLVLLAGRLVDQDKATDQGLLWLTRLWATSSASHGSAQVYHDVRLAALVYQSMGGRVAFAASDLNLEAEIEAPLRQALGTLFAARDAVVPPADRMIAGRVLGELGDPRFPVSHPEWQASLTNLSTELTNQGEHYWRYVPAGRYQIGGWEQQKPSAEHDLPAFWIARLPITVAQFTRFVETGYCDDAHWTAHGLAWRGKRTAPYPWGNPAYSDSNQPVVFITWYEATAFCRWLTTELTIALPANHSIRLPTEAEWDAAAAFAGPGPRREYPWGDQPEPDPQRAVYNAWQLNAPAPVGLCPAGMVACGALDLAGNVWEWTSSSYQGYPKDAVALAKDFTENMYGVPVRGSAWWDNSRSVRCDARYTNLPDNGGDSLSMRVVVSVNSR